MNKKVKILFGIIGVGVLSYFLFFKKGKSKFSLGDIKFGGTKSNATNTPIKNNNTTQQPAPIVAQTPINAGDNVMLQQWINSNTNLSYEQWIRQQNASTIATNQGIQENWQQLQHLLGFANDPNNPTMSFLDPASANAAYQNYTTMVNTSIAQGNALDDIFNSAVNSFFNGNPQNLHSNYYVTPDGRLGLHIFSPIGGNNCPDGYEYNETTKYCEWIPS